jgi:hypothetical protein
MGGVAPKLVITDDDLSMRTAIRDVFQGTIHRLCNTLTSDDDFMSAFMACVWGSESPNEFEARWCSIISRFGLESNSWLSDKYNMRSSWIAAYFMNFSLRTTSRSESENACFRHFVHRWLHLLEFWIRF